MTIDKERELEKHARGRKRMGCVLVDWDTDKGIVDLTRKKIVFCGFGKDFKVVSSLVPIVRVEDDDFPLVGVPADESNWEFVVALLLSKKFPWFERVVQL